MKIEINTDILSILSNSKNLLAFSGGVDSTALFHLLLERGIDFDIALVNYGLREQAKDEEAYAKELAQRYNKRVHIAYATKWTKDFEANARRFRYNFFEELIEKEGYNNLITAHQLNDRVEWLMMRFIRGAGVSELAGIKDISKRVTKNGLDYSLIRPLLNISRDDIEKYLNGNSIKYFIDSSNLSNKYERNRFRKLCNPLISEYSKGIAKSFEYLESDRAIIESLYRVIYQKERFFIIEYDSKAIIDRACDSTLKRVGYLMSANERLALKSNNSIVVGRKWAVEIGERYIYIAPYIQDIKMPKSFKEECRIYKIPPKCRAYIYTISLPPKNIFYSLD